MIVIGGGGVREIRQSATADAERNTGKQPFLSHIPSEVSYRLLIEFAVAGLDHRQNVNPLLVEQANCNLRVVP